MEQAEIIPTETRYADTAWFYRIFEILPGVVTWSFLLAPVILSLFAPAMVAYFIIAFDLFWLMKSARMSFGLLRGYRRLKIMQKVDWQAKLNDLNNLEESRNRLQSEMTRLSRYRNTIRYQQMRNELREVEALLLQKNMLLRPEQIYQAIIMPIYKESLDTVRPSIESVLDCKYDNQKIIFVLAYEQRGGEADELVAKTLEKEFKDRFGAFLLIQHPDGLPGEIKGKGANISFAGRKLLTYANEQKIPLNDVIVTTLDADNRPDKQYFNYLTYKYCADPNRRRKSFQPIPMYLNNIWDIPALTRVVATSNSFWMIIEATRPHRLRNFSAHAQSLQSLVDTDFWSVTTIVEDGHQFWRAYFAYDGDHQVEPIYLPIYQDAVLSTTFLRTIRAQFLQMRRWAYGVSDFPFVIKNSVKNRKIPLSSKIVQTWRLFEGHFSWATAPLILAFAAWLPLFLNQEFREKVLAHQLPLVASRIMTIAMIGLLVTIWLSFLTLPPRPKRYRKGKYLIMLVQWVLSPATAIFFGSFASINAQTRLMIGKRLDVFQVTEKVVRK